MTAEELRARILGADDRPVEAVECPEWDATVYVRTMSAGDRDAWGRLWETGERSDKPTAKSIPKDMAAHLVALTACDANGVRLFTDEDLPALVEKNGRVIERIAKRAMAFNRLLDGSIESAAKN